MKYRAVLLPAVALGLLLQYAQGGSATWNLNPGSNDWQTATNWTPATVPNSPTDVATFGVSNLTSVSVASTTSVDGIVFDANASSYTISVGPTTGTSFVLTLSGAGITNNSGALQNFVCTTNAAKSFGTIAFSGNAGAGNANYVCNAGTVSFGTGGTILFNSTSSGEMGTFTLHGGILNFERGGAIFFNDTSTAGSGVYTVEGGSLASFPDGATLTFDDSSTAGDGTFIVLRGIESSAFFSPGHVDFLANSSAGNATITVDGDLGAIDSGGRVSFQDDSTGGNARFIFTGGRVLCDEHNAPGLSMGSIEGNGEIILSTIDLAIGGSNRTTDFSGVISGFAATVTKVGSGTLILSGANTYSGGTAVQQGTLRVENSTGSATGPGFVSVIGSGTLSGNGTIGGVVLVGGGSGKGTLAPSTGSRGGSTLVIERMLNFRKNSSYMTSFIAQHNSITGDFVEADGVSINGATIVLHGRTDPALPAGSEITLISNTSATPISGTFRNLADGAVVTVDGTDFQSSYEGGDGNDLTLTALP